MLPFQAHNAVLMTYVMTIYLLPCINSRLLSRIYLQNQALRICALTRYIVRKGSAVDYRTTLTAHRLYLKVLHSHSFLRQHR